MGLFYRYVGFTRRDPNQRYEEHIADKSNTAKVKWIQRCLWLDIPIALEILETLVDPTDEEIIQKEQELIEQYKAYADLVNSTKGGEGVKQRQKVITQSDRECLVCSTLFSGDRYYCSIDCRRYARKLAAIPKPEFRVLFLNKYHLYECQCSSCNKEREAFVDAPYVDPRNLNIFSRDRIPLLDDKL